MSAANPNQVLFSDVAKNEIFGPGKEEYAGDPFSSTQPVRVANLITLVAKHDRLCNAHVMDSARCNPAPPRQPARVFYDRIQRTEFLAAELELLLKASHNSPLHICEHSALTTFGIVTEERAASIASDYTPQYLDDLKRQRQALEKLAQCPATHLRLIMQPDASRDIELKKLRTKALLKWMRKSVNKKNVQWVYYPFSGHNRLTVAGRFSIDGFKTQDEAGYEMSIAHLDPEVIRFELKLFENAWRQAEKAGLTKQQVLNKVAAEIQ